MKYTYATLLLQETDAEINERNLTDVLDAAGAEVTASRSKAYVAALEGVAIDEHTAPAEPPSTEREPPSGDGTTEPSTSTVGAADEAEDGAADEIEDGAADEIEDGAADEIEDETVFDELASDSTGRDEASETE